MNLTDLRSQLPDYAKDLRLNLESVLSDTGAAGLEPAQIRAIALASAIAARHAPLVAAIEAFAAEQLSPEQINGARAAAAIMAMSNIYYRATHLIHNDEYGPARRPAHERHGQSRAR
jgi:lipoyl-dependent peroxiredoxin subunit D